MSNHVTIEGRTLHRAMKIACAITEKRSVIPILSTVRLSYENVRLKITATDLEREVQVIADEIDGKGEWSICVDAFLLARIAREAGPAPVKIEPGQGKEADALIVIGDDAAVYTVKTIAASDFPTINGMPHEKIDTFTNGMLATMLNKVAAYISREETRYYLNGVYWHIDASGRRFVATDGHRLARCHYSSEGAEQPGRIIPRRTVEFITRHMPSDIVAFSTDQGHVIDFSAGDVFLRTKLIDGTYPDYTRVIPKREAAVHEFRFRQDELMTAIRQAAAIERVRKGSAGPAIRFLGGAGRLAIERKNCDAGTAVAQTSVEWPSKRKLEPFGFNTRYMLEIAGTCQDEIRLIYQEPDAPFLIEDADDTMTRVIMPMRV